LVDNNAELLSRCLRKEVAAEYQLYHQLAPRMYGICLRYGGNETEAQDILQNGFIRFFSNLHQYRSQGSIEAWAHRIFVTSAVNYYRQNLKFSQVEELTDDIDDAISLKNSLTEKSTAELLGLIQCLPSGSRTVFNLFVLENYGHKEIAEMLGISENTSKSQLRRAKSAVRQMLDTREK
jgi:RNA polymerase sigma factor (sigma-70 family)